MWMRDRRETRLDDHRKVADDHGDRHVELSTSLDGPSMERNRSAAYCLTVNG